MPKGAYNSFIWVKIGGLTLHQTEDHIMTLQNKRIASDLTGTVILTVYDDSAYLVEAAIINGETTFSYSYGYVNGKKSNEFTALITHVGAEMTARGMILTVEGAPEGSDKTNETNIKSYSGMTIDQIVAQIASEQGWSIKVNVPCKPVYVDSMETTSDYKTYIQDGMGAEEFIKQKLIPDAVSEDGQGGYVFHLETTDAGKFMSFMPVGYQSDNVASSFTFIVGQDNENIISFNPDYDKLLVAMMGGGGIEADVVNPTTNEGVTYQMLKGKTSATENAVTFRIAGSSYSQSELDAIATNLWSKLSGLNYKATMVLVGDPTLRPTDYINVVVLTPDNRLHHTSGRYFINSIEDMLETGVYNTTLDLTKVNDSSDVSGGTYGGGTDNSFTPLNTGADTTGKPTGSYTGGGASGYTKCTQNKVNPTTLNEILMGYVGIPYVWGGSSRDGVDCSGFVHLAFQENGWGSVLANQRLGVKSYWDNLKSNSAFVEITSQSDLQSGDIIIMDGGNHMGIALGNGKMIHAPKPGDTVRVANIWKFTTAFRYKNYPSGITFKQQTPTKSSGSGGGAVSSLACTTILSPHRTSPRKYKIDTITIHCMAGNLTVESCGQVFQNREASSNYGVGSDGRIACYVPEGDRSWCTSSGENDHRAVTIEVANSQASHPWPVTQEAYNATIQLVADICRRNGIIKLMWKADKSLIGHVDQQNMTAHRWFAAKACPGDYLYDYMGDIAAKVNDLL